jgi:hypothetical protein
MILLFYKLICLTNSELLNFDFWIVLKTRNTSSGPVACIQEKEKAQEPLPGPGVCIIIFCTIIKLQIITKVLE